MGVLLEPRCALLPPANPPAHRTLSTRPQGNPKFLEAVTTWQRRLGTVDAVLGVWADTQRKWQALQSIFVGSADIRVQLPADSARFDAINTDYVDLMRAAPAVTNVVAACSVERRQERLEGMLAQVCVGVCGRGEPTHVNAWCRLTHARRVTLPCPPSLPLPPPPQLELCEKALQDDLETKRMAFPRFYFVAPADLLDILSHGSDPQAILRRARRWAWGVWGAARGSRGGGAASVCNKLTIIVAI